MKNKKLKKIIEQELLLNGKIVLSKVRLFKCGPLYQKLYKLTSFLPINVLFKERIYCIYHDINFIKVCPKCGEKLKFSSFINGYKKCKNFECNKEEILQRRILTGKKITATLNSIDENGLTRAQNISKKAVKTRSEIGPDGLTVDQRNGIKASKTLHEIEENGFTRAQNRAIKSAKTMTSTICEDGLTLAQKIGIKSSNTLKQVQADGLTGYQKNAKKQSETLRQIEENGLTRAQNIMKKTVKTKRKIGLDGLDSFERAFKHNTVVCQIKSYPKTNLYYQGSLERKFLDLTKELGFIHQISKSKKRFFYKFGGKKRSYRIDFEFDKKIYFEIKSHWTYDFTGKDLNLRKANNLKFLSVVKKGYKFYVVWDNKWISQFDCDDFLNLEKSLYSKSILFTKEALLHIFKQD